MALKLSEADKETEYWETVARLLAKKLSLPHRDLEPLHSDEEWLAWAEFQASKGRRT